MIFIKGYRDFKKDKEENGVYETEGGTFYEDESKFNKDNLNTEEYEILPVRSTVIKPDDNKELYIKKDDVYYIPIEKEDPTTLITYTDNNKMVECVRSMKRDGIEFEVEGPKKVRVKTKDKEILNKYRG